MAEAKLMLLRRLGFGFFHLSFVLAGGSFLGGLSRVCRCRKDEMELQ